MDKLVLETQNKKLTFMKKNDTLSIDFFSIEEDNEFFISSENKELYKIFDDVLSKLNKDNINLLGENIKEIYIYGEDELKTSLVLIQVLESGVKLTFSSTFYTEIVVLIDDNKDSEILNELYDRLINLELNFYQAFVDESLNEGKEYRIELK